MNKYVTDEKEHIIIEGDTDFSTDVTQAITFVTDGKRTYTSIDMEGKPIYYTAKTEERSPELHKQDVMMYAKELIAQTKKTHLHLYVRKLLAYILQECTCEEYRYPDLKEDYKEYRKVNRVQKVSKEDALNGQLNYALPIKPTHYNFFSFVKGVTKKEQYTYFFTKLEESFAHSKEAFSVEKYNAITQVLATLKELQDLDSFTSNHYVVHDCQSLNELLNVYGLLFSKSDMLRVDYNERVKQGIHTFLDVTHLWDVS